MDALVPLRRFAVLLLLAAAPLVADPPFPADPAALTRPVPYDAMAAWLGTLSGDHVRVSSIGRSAAGRELWMVRLQRSPADTLWRVLAFGQQHGNEPAGKDALLYWVHRYAADPERLPRGVSLHVIPMLNPDGAEAGQRRNAAGADLNRDHQLLDQPETRALHAAARRLRPHVAIDCHEFTRDSRDYAERGWLEWPEIMMDCANHPLLPDVLFTAGLEWVEGARAPMAAAGFNYTRYMVGGPPPDTELRFSTLETDDARNGLAAYGILSFIIESGVRRAAPDPHADLGRRVAAYLALLDRFVHPEPGRIAAGRAAVHAAAEMPLPPFIPVNQFWGAVGLDVREVPVIDTVRGETVMVTTGEFMSERIVKGTVPAPRGYLIPEGAAAPFRELLTRHGIAVETPPGDSLLVERAILERVEGEWDPLYRRYDGRQIVRWDTVRTIAAGEGDLWIPLDGRDARRIALVLEPGQLYGLYQDPRYAGLADERGVLPVMRVVGGGKWEVGSGRWEVGSGK